MKEWKNNNEINPTKFSWISSILFMPSLSTRPQMSKLIQSSTPRTHPTASSPLNLLLFTFKLSFWCRFLNSAHSIHCKKLISHLLLFKKYTWMLSASYFQTHVLWNTRSPLERIQNVNSWIIAILLTDTSSMNRSSSCSMLLLSIFVQATSHLHNMLHQRNYSV